MPDAALFVPSCYRLLWGRGAAAAAGTAVAAATGTAAAGTAIAGAAVAAAAARTPLPRKSCRAQYLFSI